MKAQLLATYGTDSRNAPRGAVKWCLKLEDGSIAFFYGRSDAEDFAKSVGLEMVA